MSAWGELETEVSLPVRLEYELSAGGDLEIVALVFTGDGLPDGVRLDFMALPAREQRSLQALAHTAAARKVAAAGLDRRLSERE